MFKMMGNVLAAVGAVALLALCGGAFLLGGPVVGFAVTVIVLLLAIAMK